MDEIGDLEVREEGAKAAAFRLERSWVLGVEPRVLAVAHAFMNTHKRPQNWRIRQQFTVSPTTSVLHLCLSTTVAVF